MYLYCTCGHTLCDRNCPSLLCYTEIQRIAAVNQCIYYFALKTRRGDSGTKETPTIRHNVRMQRQDREWSRCNTTSSSQFEMFQFVRRGRPDHILFALLQCVQPAKLSALRFALFHPSGETQLSWICVQKAGSLSLPHKCWNSNCLWYFWTIACDIT